MSDHTITVQPIWTPEDAAEAARLAAQQPSELGVMRVVK